MTIAASIIALEGAGLRLRSLVGAALLALGPGTAWACMPEFHEHERPVRVEGRAGAVAWLYGIWKETSIGPAEDLGGGFVREEMLEGSFCRGEAATLIHDCTTGQAVAFGGEFERMIVQTYEDDAALAELVDERTQAGQPLSIAEISEEAVTRGVEFVVPMRTTSTIAMGEYEFELGQACRTHYPGSVGAEQ